MRILESRLQNGEITDKEQSRMKQALARKNTFDAIRASSFQDIRIMDIVTGLQEVPVDYLPLQFTIGGETRCTHIKRHLAEKLGLIKAHLEEKKLSCVDDFASRLRAVTLSVDQAKRLKLAIDFRTRPTYAEEKKDAISVDSDSPVKPPSLEHRVSALEHHVKKLG